MSLFTKVLDRVTPSRLKVAGIVALVALTAGLGATTGKVVNAEARDCSANSIIECGALSPSEFISEVKANKPGDLKVVYQNFGLAPSDDSKFVSTAEMGTSYRNGNVEVHSQIVARDAWSIGRDHISGSSKYTIGGKTYYKGRTQDVYGVNSIPVMVMFNSQGVMQFAALTACGNPVTGNKVQPSYACNELKSTHVSGNTFSFSTDASASQNASIDKVVYNFGDGSATVTKANPSDVVTHTFTKTSTVTVKVYVNLPGNQTVVVESSKCSKYIVVTPTPPPAVNLVCCDLTLIPGSADSEGNVKYTLKAQATVKNATITGYTFDFGQGQGSTTVSTSSTSSSTTHTFAPGSYTVTVTVNATANGKTYTATSADCSKMINVTPPPPPAIKLVCCDLTLTPGTADSEGNVEYTLNAVGSVTNATITGYTFDFGGNLGTKTVNTSSTNASTSFTYPPGDYTATVTVNATANGKTYTATSADCSKPVHVTPPPVASSIECNELTATPGTADSEGNMAFTFVATATPNNADINSYTFDFGQGQGTSTVDSTDSSNTVTHTYAPGNYTVTVTVNGTLADGSPATATSDACSVQITVPTPPSTPAPTCTSPSGQTFPVGSAQCKPATTLPNTGPGDVAELFSGVTLSGAGAHRLLVTRRARRGIKAKK